MDQRRNGPLFAGFAFAWLLIIWGPLSGFAQGFPEALPLSMGMTAATTPFVADGFESRPAFPENGRAVPPFRFRDRQVPGPHAPLVGSVPADRPRDARRCIEGSLYWPRPYSASLPTLAADNLSGASSPEIAKRLNRPFDALASFTRVVPYQRADNGYCGNRWGRNADTMGRVGETRAELGIYGSAAGVVGLGIRDPGAPIRRPN